MKPFLFAVALFALAGCSSTSPVRDTSGDITPYDAIQLAAAAAPGGVPGTFDMRIQAAGSQGGNTYLNTEHDYRDQRNLTLALPPGITQELEARLGADPKTALLGKRLRVTGEARRITIWFFDGEGRPTGKYYYQTHVLVSGADQIEVVGWAGQVVAAVPPR
ncbi:hypothetical protein [Coralloluteibacterium thermophilus]|uniref:Lipoprotein n=1 Tax=Coralloluteibacterium thermophilum TaxID=2707049 RepID=A0ABV9NJF9_9GAMM